MSDESDLQKFFKNQFQKVKLSRKKHFKALIIREIDLLEKSRYNVKDLDLSGSQINQLAAECALLPFNDNYLRGFIYRMLQICMTAKFKRKKDILDELKNDIELFDYILQKAHRLTWRRFADLFDDRELKKIDEYDSMALSFFPEIITPDSIEKHLDILRDQLQYYQAPPVRPKDDDLNAFVSIFVAHIISSSGGKRLKMSEKAPETRLCEFFAKKIGFKVNTRTLTNRLKRAQDHYFATHKNT